MLALYCAGGDLWLDQAQIAPTAVLCAERLPPHRHRAMITDYPVVSGVPLIIHVLDVNHHALHRLSTPARWNLPRAAYSMIHGSGEQIVGYFMGAIDRMADHDASLSKMHYERAIATSIN